MVTFQGQPVTEGLIQFNDDRRPLHLWNHLHLPGSLIHENSPPALTLRLPRRRC